VSRGHEGREVGRVKRDLPVTGWHPATTPVRLSPSGWLAATSHRTGPVATQGQCRTRSGSMLKSAIPTKT